MPLVKAALLTTLAIIADLVLPLCCFTLTNVTHAPNSKHSSYVSTTKKFAGSRPSPLPVRFSPVTPSFCHLPPDFWCDHRDTIIACTGTAAFCDAYKKTRHGKKVAELKLAFESGCPDSQKLCHAFVVNRLYPKVLGNPTLSPLVDFKAIPWGLAKRQYDQHIMCHHGPRECVGNRFLSCLFRHSYLDSQARDRVFFCFMAHMMSGGAPELGMFDCLAKARTGREQVDEILQCTQTEKAHELQSDDEADTAKIVSPAKTSGSPRFVPYVALNGRAHIHMQAPMQLLLPEKIRHWNRTLNKKPLLPPIGKRSIFAVSAQPHHKCEFPPEFWCSDDAITSACYSQEKCEAYRRSIQQRPVELRIIYNSKLDTSRDYLSRYLRQHFFSGNAPVHASNADKAKLYLEPAYITKTMLSECQRLDANACREKILQICAVGNTEPGEQRNAQLMCINDLGGSAVAGSGMNDIVSRWRSNCILAEAQREKILSCTNNEHIWRPINAQLAVEQRTQLHPEARRMDPWIVLNGHSLVAVQHYAYVLDQMICQWFVGPDHDRSSCGRCEYEETHCKK